MAIALEHANIGVSGSADPGSTTITFTTNQTVAAGSFIVVCCGGFIGGATTMTVSGGGLTWTTDIQGKPTLPAASFCALASAQAPSGLASGTVITGTYTASTAARMLGGSSFTGVKTSSPAGTTSGPTGINTVQTAWATASTSISSGSVLIGANYTETGALTSTPTAGTSEALDWQQAGSPTTMTTGYRIEASAASYTVAGTWSGAGGKSAIVAVEYQAAVATPPDIEDGFAAPAGMFSPTLLEKGWFY